MIPLAQAALFGLLAGAALVGFLWLRDRLAQLAARLSEIDARLSEHVRSLDERCFNTADDVAQLRKRITPLRDERGRFAPKSAEEGDAP